MATLTVVSQIKDAEFYPCPTCSASYRERCRTRKTGRTTNTHMARIDQAQRYHSRWKCEGEACCIHNPSTHPLGQRPLRLRGDLWPPIYERICVHGVGHPDPDSAAWAERDVRDNPLKWQNDVSDGKYVWIHGCDGCC